MRVELKTLKPNPTRDFAVDPIEEDRIAPLVASIKEDGFWGGIVCRQTADGIEIGAGHHRVAAAIAAGITHADVFVSEKMTTEDMIRVYARENATQRGNSGAAQAGSVAAAIRFLAKRALTSSEKGRRPRSDETKLGHLTSTYGLGNGVVWEFLKTVPGASLAAIKDQITNLKSSGHYARIISEDAMSLSTDGPATCGPPDPTRRSVREFTPEHRAKIGEPYYTGTTTWNGKVGGYLTVTFEGVDDFGNAVSSTVGSVPAYLKR